jgi:hypothetical protein
MCLFEFILEERDEELMKPVKGAANCKCLGTPGI